MEALGRGVGPFVVGRQAPVFAGLGRVPFGVGGRVEPAHADHRQGLRRRIDSPQFRAGGGGDAARVCGLADRLDHDVERRVEPRRAAGASIVWPAELKVADRLVGEPAGLQGGDRRRRDAGRRAAVRREDGGGGERRRRGGYGCDDDEAGGRIVQPPLLVLRRDGARRSQAIGPGRRTWVIKSSFHAPSTRKCAVAPRNTASMRLWLR